MNRHFADGSALTLLLSPREREKRRNRVEYSGRAFAKLRAEWFSLSPGERAGVRGETGPQRTPIEHVPDHNAFCFYERASFHEW